MPITPLNGDALAGIAGQYTETLNPSRPTLLTGDTPAVFTTDEIVLTGQTLAQYTVVGFDLNGKLVPAEADGDPKAIGVLAYAVDTATVAGDKTALVYRSGHFNMDVLVWDASFTTDALKKKAFEGSPSPTQIVVGRPAAMSV